VITTINHKDRQRTDFFFFNLEPIRIRPLKKEVKSMKRMLNRTMCRSLVPGHRGFSGPPEAQAAVQVKLQSGQSAGYARTSRS